MDSIIDTLAEYFSPKFNENLKRCENLEMLIKNLNDERVNIQAMLTQHLSESEREALLSKHAVLTVQINKAEQLLKTSLES